MYRDSARTHAHFLPLHLRYGGWKAALFGVALLGSLPFAAQALIPLAGIKAISAGSFHTCAVITGGTAKCWGANNDFYLGDNTPIDRLTRVNVGGVESGVMTIEPG